MASRISTPRSRSNSRSSTTSSASSDTTMLDAPPLTPARPRQASHSTAATPAVRSSAAKDPAFSALLSLPRELRNRIYTYSLTSQFPFWWPSPAPVKHDVALGLLSTSRQIYEEAAPVLYSQNKFLFTHPSDCNVFRIVASPKYSALISAVYFRIRSKDLRLWTTYLGSKSRERSLEADLPRLRSLWMFLRCGTVGHASIGGHQAAHGFVGLPPALAAQVQAVQNALGQQVQALQQQVQSLTQAMQAAGQGHAPPIQQGPFPGANDPPSAESDDQQVPLPPPPPPAMPFHQFANNFQPQAPAHHLHHLHHHPPPGQPHDHGTQDDPSNPSPPQITQNNPNLHHHGHTHPLPPPHHTHAHTHGPFYTSFLRWERELGLENLCLSLQETRPKDADIKIVCIMRLPKPEVERLCRLYPEELSVDRNGDARTRFRKLHGVEVCLEVSGFEI